MKRQFKIKDDTFSGETYGQYNGSVVTEEMDKENKPVMGTSGTKGYLTARGGRLYLQDDQVVPA